MVRGAQRTKANNYNLLWLKQKELVCDENSALQGSPPLRLEVYNSSHCLTVI